MSDREAPAFDGKAFRDVMGHYPTGVAVVTGRASDGEILALVVGTLSSVSLEPPLVSFMPMKTSNTFKKMQECKTWCINVLSSEQEDEAMLIARRWENKLDGIKWHPSPSGDPILDNAVSWIDVSNHELVEAGDHWIVLCKVHDMEVLNSVNPLVFFQGGFGGFVGNSLLDGKSTNILPAIQAAHTVQDELKELAEKIGCQITVAASLGEGELATVYSAVGGAAKKEAGLADRLPCVPPIGDTVIALKGDDAAERWIAKAKNADEETIAIHRRRLNFIREHGYVTAFLQEAGSAAYETMINATQEFQKARLTPGEERAIAESIYSAQGVDYEPQVLEKGQRYDIAAIAMPVEPVQGETILTLRLSQLPSNLDGEVLNSWVDQLKEIGKLIKEEGQKNYE